MVQIKGGYTKDQAVKTTGHQHKYTNTHTLMYSTHTTTPPNGTQSPESTSKPEAGRKNSPRQNTTGRLLAFVAPLLQKNTPLIPSNPPKILDTWTTPPQFRAQLLAWPDLSSCTDAFRPVEDLQMLNGDG